MQATVTDPVPLEAQAQQGVSACIETVDGHSLTFDRGKSFVELDVCLEDNIDESRFFRYRVTRDQALLLGAQNVREITLTRLP